MEKFTACDFDGTIFTGNWPGIGDPIWPMINSLKQRQSRGEKIGLWTCREGKMLIDALEACEKVGLIFDAVNENLQERTDYFQIDPRKMGADEYIDDHATNVEDIINPRPAWTSVTDGLPVEYTSYENINWVLTRNSNAPNLPPFIMRYYEGKWYRNGKVTCLVPTHWIRIPEFKEEKTYAQ